jgi:enamine deaminase RidA (YjgF/YER057c/UK114 family)
MTTTLAELDAMSIEGANALHYEDRDQLLDLIIADGRHQATGEDSYRVGLYSDYFEEDMVRMLKVKAIKVLPRGTTSSGFDGAIVGDTDEEQYRAAFRHIETSLKAAGTGFHRVVILMIFLTDMDKWSLFNKVYSEFITDPPCRAVIGTTGLAQPPLVIEIVECIAYKVAK